MSNRHSSSSIGYQSNSESRTSYVFWCTTFILVRLHNIWVTVSLRSLHPATGTDSDCVTRLTTHCREHAPSLANVVSTTPVRPPGTLCHLTYMTLLTLTYSRNDSKLFCLIVRTDLSLLLYGAPGWFVERRLTNLSLYLYLYWNPTCTGMVPIGNYIVIYWFSKCHGYLDHSYHGLRTISTMDYLYHVWTIRTMDRYYQNSLWYKWSTVRIVHGTNSPWYEWSIHCTKSAWYE